MRKNLYLLSAIIYFCTFYLAAHAQVTTSTFVYTGSVQTYTVPSGVTSLTVDTRGANGGMEDKWYYTAYYFGPCYTSRGGYGARVICTLAVTSGQVLYVYVGGNGDSSTYYGGSGTGGWNGGGSGYNSGHYSGGGGGGASDIRTSGTALSNRIIIAGGGGGCRFSELYIRWRWKQRW